MTASSAVPSTVAVLGPHQLPDGTRVLLRPLVPADRDALVAAFAGLSAESRYHRFLAPLHGLTPTMLTHLVDDVDGVDHVAVVCEVVGGDAVGIGRYVRERGRPRHAEAAVTVHDDWHGRGVGRLLASAVATLAWQHDIRYFTALVHADNAPSLAMLARLGVVVERSSSGYGVVDVVVELHPETYRLDG